MICNLSIRLTLVAVALCAGANAATVFNFDNDTPGTSTNFTDTVGGLSGTFSSTADPGGFVIYGSIFNSLTGNVLGDPGPANANGLDLAINFSSNLSVFSLDFATADFGTPSPLIVTAYENAMQVGSFSATGIVPNGFDFPEGQIAFNGTTFNNVVVSSSAPDFVVDNITVDTPEPRDVSLLGLGLIALSIPALRRRARPTPANN
jgi:hypothetical protein